MGTQRNIHECLVGDVKIHASLDRSFGEVFGLVSLSGRSR
jgi:hypothetical protein